jgi:DeoR/GlpR family transcriptional regulator of sugar metabolism
MRRERGYIAVLSTLIVGAVSLAIVVGVLLLGVSSQKSSFVSQWQTQARGATDGCTEEALQQIQSNTAFTGTNTVTIGTESCTYTVANTGVTTRTISASATVGSVVRKVQVYVTIASSSISITSWQEVS